jgi:hypothetical protein
MDLNLYEFIFSYHFIIYANLSHGFMMKVKQIKVKGKGQGQGTHDSQEMKHIHEPRGKCVGIKMTFQDIKVTFPHLKLGF